MGSNIDALQEKDLKMSVNKNFLMGVLFMLMLIFVIVTIKHRCIKIGYEISDLSKSYEQKMIVYQSFYEDKSMLTNKKNLYEKAESLGLYLPDYKSIFYVE